MERTGHLLGCRARQDHCLAMDGRIDGQGGRWENAERELSHPSTPHNWLAEVGKADKREETAKNGTGSRESVLVGQWTVSGALLDAVVLRGCLFCLDTPETISDCVKCLVDVLATVLWLYRHYDQGKKLLQKKTFN